MGRIRSLTYSQSYWSGNTSVTIEGDYYGSHVIFEDSTSVTVGGSMFGGYFYMRSSGNLIVKGAVLSYLREMSGTGTVAANVISVDSSATYSGGTIIANQLTNCLYSSVSAATVKDQRYTDFTFSSTSSTAVSDYGSLTPFITYATSSSTVTTYTFSGSSLWLFGYVPDTVDGHYDMTVSVMDGSSNPLNAIITALEAGDLTDSVLEQQMEDTDSEAECVMIGSPAYDSTRRTVSVSGSAIRAAGNLTFWNDTEITAGTVTAGGSLLCMRDMTISGGAVTADAIGNVYTNTVTDAENNVRWCETIIDGVTVTADLVGAPTDRNDSWTPRSTVVLQNGGSVTSHKEVSVTFVQDIYINYVYDTSIFSVSNDRPQTLRFTGSSLESMSLVDDSLEALASVSVAAPTVIADKSEGSWHFESLTGPVTASFRADGTVLDKEGEAAEDESAYQDKELLVLYAVQDENTLTVVEGSEYVNSTFTVGDGSRTFNASYAAEVSSGSTVTLTLTEAAVTAGMADNKFVVWYYTGSEENDNLVLHSVETEVAEGSISFEMPYTATEVYVTNELTLYLNLYEIQFTSTGFNVELGDSPREDACFTYAGNLRITQSNIDSTTTPHTNYSVSYPVKAVVDGETESTASDTVSQYVTNNHMVFAAGSGSTGRTVTFESVIQRSETTDPGIDVADGEDITLTIDGAVQLGNINIDSGTVSIVGANKDEDKDILHIARIWTEWDFVSSTLIGNSSGTSTANIDMRDLTLYVGNRMTFAYTMGGMVTLTDCFVNAKNWVYYSVFAMYADQVTFDKTSVYIGYGSDTDRTNNFCFFRSCNNVTVKNDSSVEYYLTGSGSGDYSSSFYSGVTGTMTIENSKVTTKYATDANNSGSQLLTWSALPTKVVVSGDSVLTVDQRLMLKALEVTDDASVVVKNDDADSYLFCQDVTVNTTGTVSADYIVISGFVYATDSFVSDNSFMSSTSSYVTSGSFSLQNGTVEAKFVGGDLDATIAVSGGTLNADTVGTYGALFGYTRYVPKRNGEKWAYTLEQIPESAAVTISGGTVNISDYLGGMNSTVSVTGGKVKLADGAVLGITDEDLETLMTSYSEAGEEMGTSCTVSITGGTVEATGTNGTASILADYGSVYIGGDCEGVSVYDLTAENGEITIESVSGVYTNPYRGTDKDHNQVGIYVSHLLEAQEILIQAGAVVWAAEAYANVEDGDQGSLTVVADVEDGQANSGYLYTEQYGSGGAGETTVETVQDSESVTHIYGTQVSTITYYLNDDETDPATNDGNPTSYTLGQTNSDGSLTVTLVEPEREHYQFTGWYDNEECEGDPVGLSLSTSSAINYTLYAGWEPETVTFTITVTADDSYDLEEETEGKAGTLSADKTSFTFTQTVTVAYRDAIIGDGDGHIVLSNFDLNSYAIRQLKVDDTDYSGEVGVISDSTVVTKDLVEEYLDTDTINLTAVLVTKKSVKITLDLNQNEYGRPTTTAFESSLTEAEKTESTYLYTYVDINANILTADGFYTGTLQADGSVTGKALIGATATGYDFLGWFDEDDSQLTADFTVTQNGSSTFYAKWSPKTYTVSFDANGGSAVTASSSVEPTATDPDAMTGTVVYDTEIDGGIAWSATETEQSLPTAWKSGYVFLGWSTDPNGDENSILAEDAELNAETLESALNTEAGTDETALTLYAVYRKVQITYITAGGTWQNGWSGETYTDTDPDTSLGYSAPLAAYQYEESTETYAFISTTATEFSTNGDNYNDGDYRETIQYKGYTFTGWYLTDAETGEVSETDAVTSTPLYSDITVTAGWTANSYSLNLYAYEEGENDTFNSFTYGGTQPVTGYVTVGKEITESNAGSWPDRSDWYAASNSATSGDDDAKRYLLGFTFDAFEPGDSLAEEGTDGYTAYNAYGTKVTELVNNNTLFTREETGADGTTSGSIFYLPDGSVYGSSHASDESDVPDYPNGSTIDMYAVYREVSLVFIEYYTDQDNQVQETVMSSVPWNDYYDYPSDYETDGWQKLVEDQGYTLISWKIGGTDETLPDYGSDTYGEESLRQQYKDAAAATGAMDIKVYTYYVAQVTVEDEQWLTSNTNPRDSENLYSQESVEYIIPGSMKSGTLNYKIAYTETTDGTADTELKLVTWDDLKDYLYETSWGSGNTANNTVAIKLELLAQDETTGEWEAVDLSNGSGVYETWLKESGSIGNVTVVSGWKLRLTMYHSGVISESLTDLYDLTFTYANNEEQYIKFENLYLDLEPSVWDVNYVLNLPNDARITWPESGFVEETTYRTVSTEYGADLWDASCLPAVAGYEASAVWTVTSGASETTVAMGNPFTLTVSAESAGAVTLEVTWTKKSYTLSADEDVLQKDSADWWKVSYGDEALNRTFLQWLTGQAASAAVPYLTTVVFSNDDAAAKAENILLTLTYEDESTETVRLDEYEEVTYDSTEGTYTFLMPAASVHASYSDTVTLYLEGGNITIEEDGYTYNGEYHTWSGSYIILMDAENNLVNEDGVTETSNTLTLEGDLSGRSIALGNLSITSDDSIVLTEGSTAELTLGYNGTASTIDAQNILVPAGADLTMNLADDVDTGTLNLSPSSGYAAIGGSSESETATSGAQSGTITLNDLTVNLTLSAGNASGIGSGDQSSGGGEITLTDCVITVTEAREGATSYTGVWIGGNGVSSVTLDGTQVALGADSTLSADLQTYTLYADEIAIINESSIGTESAPVRSPIYAEDELTITDSTVYQNIQNVQTYPVVAIGTSADGSMTISGSTVDAEVRYPADGLYTGTLYIEDAASDVVIAGTQILETNNGNIAITDEKVIQGSSSHDHDGSYLIINSYADDGTADSAALTVTSIADSKTITTAEVTLTNVDIDADTTIILDGDLTITGKVDIASGVTLTVDAAAVNDQEEYLYGVTLESSATVTDNSGTYAQEGGSLASYMTDGIICDQLDIELTDVTTTAANLIAHNLTLDGGSVTATNGQVGSQGVGGVTTVSITNGTEITAATIGALGAQSSTFTFVVFTDEENDIKNLTGTLVRDWYRLTYVIADEYDTSNLPTVLRTTQIVADGSITATTVLDGVPDNPTPRSGFSTWYVINPGADETLGTADDISVALQETSTPSGFAYITQLNPTTVDYSNWTETTNSDDGTKTLKILAAMNISGTALIQEERQLSDTFDDTVTATSVSVPADGAWTAKFTVSGSVIAGSGYQLSLTKAFPAGTELTLAVLSASDNIVRFYHYTTTGDETTIALSWFQKMGGTESPTSYLMAGTAGATLADSFMIAADFSQAGSITASDYSDVSVQLQLIDDDSDVTGAAVSYSLYDAPTASVTAVGTANTVSATWSPKTADTRRSGETLYLVATLTDGNGNAVTVPYDAVATLGSTTGTWIAGDTVLFALTGDPESEQTYTNLAYSFEGLEEGTYQITWSLAVAASAPNVLGGIVATAGVVSYTAEAETAPSLAATITQIDGVSVDGDSADSRVLSEGTHTVTFRLTDISLPTGGTLQVRVEKQNTTLAAFEAEDDTTETVAVSGASATAEITLSDLTAGTYRIRFSMYGFAEGTKYADVYFTFVVE
ncbi:MAG: InlB B-repeat-containing protein [Lachnospiraceae bacterium]|nr:InlB B-repeat-containing protein [Lachnospiraceae bacterium]